MDALLGHGYEHSADVSAYAFVTVILFAAGGRAYRPRSQPGRSAISDEDPGGTNHRNQKFRLLVNALAMVSGVVALDLGLRTLGTGGVAATLSIDNLTTFLDALRTTKASLVADSEWAVPTGVKLATAAMVFSSALSGVEVGIGMRSRRRAYIALASSSILFMVLLSVSTGVRSFIIVGGLTMGLAFFCSKMVFSGARNAVSARSVLVGLVALGGFVGWTLLVQSARLRDFSFSRLADTQEHLRPWLAGYIPALSVWYDGGGLSGETAGWNLLRGPLNAVGLGSLAASGEQTGFSEIAPGVFSNAMTVFRAAWPDLGVFGTALAAVVVGFIAEQVFYRALAKIGAWTIWLTAIDCAIIFSINYWYFAYGSRVLGIVASALAVALWAPVLRPADATLEDRHPAIKQSAWTQAPRRGPRNEWRQHVG